LAGIIPLAGFWSKDEILIDAWHHNKGVFVFGLVAAGLTAFYMIRVIVMTFHGEYRGGEQPAPGEHGVDPSQPHESDRTMTLPLIVLAVLAVVTGFLTFGGEFQTWVGGALPEPEKGEFQWETGIFLASTIAALAGIVAAVAIYQRQMVDIAALRESRLIKPVHTVLVNKFYMDVLAEDILVRRVFYGGSARVAAAFDTDVVDGAVRGIARTTFDAGKWGRRIQNGQVQTGGAMLLAGGVVIFGAVVIF